MKKIIWIFEEEKDYEEFLEEVKKIPIEVGFIESEDEDTVMVKIINLKK